jgi:alpha-tubulin suppressor-like RCC1 family protein
MSTNCAIKSDGTLWSCGNGYSGVTGLNNTLNYSSPTQIGTDNTWSYVFATYLLVQLDKERWFSMGLGTRRSIRIWNYS